MAKIGDGHVNAMARAGLKELTQALPAFPESVRPVEEPGLVGNLTPQEIVQDKGAYEKMLGGYASRGQEQEASQQMER
jgi:hypothetical protein